MQIIKLPRVLPGKLDLGEINGQLKSRRSSLDWSGVEVAFRKALALQPNDPEIRADLERPLSKIR